MLLKNLQSFFEKYGEKILIIISGVIVACGVAVRIIMYVKCRSLWLDEAMLAESIVSRNWFELLASPLSNHQSAPVLYVIAVKAICSVLGYSEFSLRIFSFISFLGLLICEAVFVKKVLNFDNIKTAFVLVMTAILPSYIDYSNELKPYMSDAFWVVLTISLYFFYMQNKISLLKLTVFYLVILGFCSPSIFFIGGVMTTEFFVAVFAKNKKQIYRIFISGIFIVLMFGLYYYWWLMPASEYMKQWWDAANSKTGILTKIKYIFNPGTRYDSSSSFVWIFVPFALFGVYLLIKQKNKIGYSVLLSMLFLFLASSLGKWQISGRLLLFLPAIVFLFSPIGFDFILKGKKTLTQIAFVLLSAIIIYYPIRYYLIKHVIYLDTQEVNPLIVYVRKNIKENEKLYVYQYARFTLKFKNGYENKKIGNADSDNIIYGFNRDEWNQNTFGTQLDTIVKSRKAYLLFQNHQTGIDSGLAVLENYGTLTKVLEFYKTPLYYFEASE